MVRRAFLCAPNREEDGAHPVRFRSGSCDAPYLCRQTGDQFTQEALDFLWIV